MTNVVIPILHLFLTIGTTIDIRNYDFGIHKRPIYNGNDIVENPVSSSFNATYYVLPDDNIPYEKVRAPIDFILRTKEEGYSSTKRDILNGHRLITSNNLDNALVLVVAEYKTSEQTVKDNANPLPKWQDFTRSSQTHYVDKIVHGSQVISLLRIRSIVKGDVQIFRRILRDVMGTSGSVGPDTVELWKKAEKAIRESPDIRGEVFMDDYTLITNARKGAYFEDGAKLLKYVSEFPKHVDSSYNDRNFRKPLYVSFRPLNELDERYPSVTKDLEGERYLTKLYRMLRDLEFTESEMNFFLQLISVENQQEYSEFRSEIKNVLGTLREVFYNSLSVYENIDKLAMKDAFEQYYRGLDNSTATYVTEFRRIREKLVSGMTCENDFFTPTRGVLRVADDEVVRKGQVESLEKCRDFCVEDERCRAVGYSDRECLVYYRSTNSATITLPRGDSEDTKIYDRKCNFKFEDFRY